MAASRKSYDSRLLKKCDFSSQFLSVFEDEKSLLHFYWFCNLSF